VSDIDHEFTVFVAETSVRLRRTAYLLCGDREQAQDLLQTAYARTYAAWRRVRRDDAEAYTRRVLVNAHIDWYRKHPWRESTSLELPDNTPADAFEYGPWAAPPSYSASSASAAPCGPATPTRTCTCRGRS
jgi:DNA-directed RNA polymerase specialized sigma24 family protein